MNFGRIEIEFGDVISLDNFKHSLVEKGMISDMDTKENRITVI